MTSSLNSVVDFRFKLGAEFLRVSVHGDAAPSRIHFASTLGMNWSTLKIKNIKRNRLLSIATDANNTTSDDEQTAANPPMSDGFVGSESASQDANIYNDSPTSTWKEEDNAVSQSAAKRSTPLTARERLKVARLRKKSTDPKVAKTELGSKVLQVLKDDEKGKKRSGLPEAPTNLFDDSKRGMPKPGWTFQFPGGADLFFIIVSFVTISTIMLATTFIVWKSGGIHFNEF